VLYIKPPPSIHPFTIHILNISIDILHGFLFVFFARPYTCLFVSSFGTVWIHVVEKDCFTVEPPLLLESAIYPPLPLYTNIFDIIQILPL
jgi:hypothetical protein